MAIPNLEQNLQRLADMLQKIQKALGDYLEKQRQSFARFYFVGDEDLLEIIGNSKSIQHVQRHFPKMFAGITTTQFEAEGDKVVGMVSREGEQVGWSKPTIISEDPTIYVWLQKIEAAMQTSLAELLLKAITDMETLDIQEQQEDLVVLTQRLNMTRPRFPFVKSTPSLQPITASVVSMGKLSKVWVPSSRTLKLAD